MEYLEKLSKAVTAKDIKVKFVGTQASTNGRSITLPMLGNNIDETTKTILNGYCDHETGHCLYTDWNASRSVMYDRELMNITNIFEDIRIESKLIAEFKGMKGNLQAALNHVYIGIDFDRTNPLHWVFVEGRRANGLDIQDDNFTDSLNKLYPNIIGEILSCRNTSDIIELAKEFNKKSKEKPEEEPEPEEEHESKKQDSLGEKSDGTNESEKEGQDKEENKTEQSGKDNTSKDSNESECKEESEDNTISDENSNIDENGTEIEKESFEKVDASADNQFNKESESEPDMEVEGGINIEMGRKSTANDTDTFTVDYSDYKNPMEALKETLEQKANEAIEGYVAFTKAHDEIIKLEGSSVDLAAYNTAKGQLKGIDTFRRKIINLFKTQTASKWSYGKEQGKINTKALASIKAGNRLVFKEKSNSLATDCAVTLLLDYSASMRGLSKLADAKKATIMFMEAFEAMGIKSEVLGYTTNSEVDDAMGTISHRVAREYGRLEGLLTLIIKEFNEKVNNKVKAALYTSVKLSNNADSESVMIAYNRLIQRKEKRKILFVLTDGDVECFGDRKKGRDELKRVVKLIEKSPVEIIGIDLYSGSTRGVYSNRIVIEESGEGLVDKLTRGIADIFKIKY